MQTDATRCGVIPSSETATGGTPPRLTGERALRASSGHRAGGEHRPGGLTARRAAARLERYGEHRACIESRDDRRRQRHRRRCVRREYAERDRLRIRRNQPEPSSGPRRSAACSRAPRPFGHAASRPWRSTVRRHPFVPAWLPCSGCPRQGRGGASPTRITLTVSSPSAATLAPMPTQRHSRRLSHHPAGAAPRGRGGGMKPSWCWILVQVRAGGSTA